MSVYGNRDLLGGGYKDELLTEITLPPVRGLFIAIHPDNGRNFESDPYLKISWVSSFDNNKVARLSMKTGYYIIHNRMTAIVPLNIINQLNNELIKPGNPEKYVSKEEIDKVKKKNKYKQLTQWDELLAGISLITGKPYSIIKDELPQFSFDDLGPIKKGTTCIRWGSDGKYIR